MEGACSREILHFGGGEVGGGHIHMEVLLYMSIATSVLAQAGYVTARQEPRWAWASYKQAKNVALDQAGADPCLARRQWLPEINFDKGKDLKQIIRLPHSFPHSPPTLCLNIHFT